MIFKHYPSESRGDAERTAERKIFVGKAWFFSDLVLPGWMEAFGISRYYISL